MKIQAVEGVLLENKLVGQNFLVRIRTDTGLVGIGQSGAWGYPEAVERIVDHFRDYLVGQDPFRIEHHWQYLYRWAPFRGNLLAGAISAVDLALWDLKGKHFGVPVWELLGGRCRDRVRLYLLIGGSTPDEIARSAAAAAAEGFTAVKFGPLVDGWQNMTLSRLVASARDMVAAAREAVGLDVDLILEIHRKLTPMNAVVLAEALAEFHPLFYEDPIQIDSILSQSEIAQRIRIPLANGERLATIWEFRELLAHGGPQYVRPDVGIAGGLTHCKKIAAIAEAYHCAVVTHNFLGPLLTAASIHLDVAIPNFLAQEYTRQDEADIPENRVLRTTLRREGGYMLVPEAPGLGVEFDEAALAAAPPRRRDISQAPLRQDGSVAMAV